MDAATHVARDTSQESKGSRTESSKDGTLLSQGSQQNNTTKNDNVGIRQEEKPCRACTDFRSWIKAQKSDPRLTKVKKKRKKLELFYFLTLFYMRFLSLVP